MAQNSTLVQMMSSGDFSDLMFSCNGEIFKVHKVVVCSHSLIIRAAVQGGIEERQTNVIDMNQFDASTVRRLIEFMYTGDYADGKDEADHGSGNEPQVKTEDGGNSSPRSSQSADPASMQVATLLDHIRAYNIANYYRVGPLVSVTITKIRKLLESGGENASWLQSLPAAIDAALDSADDNELLDVLASAITNNISRVMELGLLKNMKGITDFSTKVLKTCVHKFQASEEHARHQAAAAEGARQEAERCIKEERQNWESRARQMEAENARLKKCIQTLNKTNSCRNTNCDQKFACNIDLNKGVLRCSTCKCRH